MICRIFLIKRINSRQTFTLLFSIKHEAPPAVRSRVSGIEKNPKNIFFKEAQAAPVHLIHRQLVKALYKKLR
jgi:hypothetical protein